MRLHSRRAQRALILSALAAGLASVGAPPAPAVAASCSAAGSTTIVQVGTLRVFRKTGPNRIYACSTQYGLKVLLESNASGLDRYARNGPQLLGYAIERGGGKLAAGVRNLRTGHVIHRRLHALNQIGDFGARRLLINGLGSIAYIFSTGGVSHANGQDVFKQDTTGVHLLDSASPLGTGTTIDTGFLQVVGPNVRWKRNGVIHSAPFH
jgi:hypothetical protein